MCPTDSSRPYAEHLSLPPSLSNIYKILFTLHTPFTLASSKNQPYAPSTLDGLKHSATWPATAWLLLPWLPIASFQGPDWPQMPFSKLQPPPRSPLLNLPSLKSACQTIQQHASTTLRPLALASLLHTWWKSLGLLSRKAEGKELCVVYHCEKVCLFAWFIRS